MFPIVAVPEIIRQGLAPYRPLFCREAGFEHIGRYVTGLILSPNKTLQGIYALQVWEDSTPPSRRAMHEAIFETGWDAEALMPHHRAIIAPAQPGQGRPSSVSTGPMRIMSAAGRFGGKRKRGTTSRSVWYRIKQS